MKWLLPIAALLGVTIYSLTLSPASKDAQRAANAPSYQLPPAALSTDQKQPMHVDDAFRLTMKAEVGGVINAYFEVEPNFYLYRDKIKVTAADGSVLTPTFPASKTKRDQHFGDSEVFDQSFAFTVPVNAASNGKAKVSATYQGCENEGICYPPVTKQFSIKVSAAQ